MKTRSAAVLTELIVILLVFMLCAALLVQLFSYALNLGKAAGAETDALCGAQNIAERIRAAEDPSEVLKENGFTEKDGKYILEEEAYTITVTLSSEQRSAGTMLVYEVEAERNGERLFVLPGKRYTGGAHA